MTCRIFFLSVTSQQQQQHLLIWLPLGSGLGSSLLPLYLPNLPKATDGLVGTGLVPYKAHSIKYRHFMWHWAAVSATVTDSIAAVWVVNRTDFEECMAKYGRQKDDWILHKLITAVYSCGNMCTYLISIRKSANSKFHRRLLWFYSRNLLCIFDPLPLVRT